MRTNRTPTHSVAPTSTFEGAPARTLGPLDTLKRMTLAALLFEDQYYRSGHEAARMIAQLVPLCSPADVQALAVECRSLMHLRHMPLFLLRELAKVRGAGSFVSAGLSQVIQRPDELTEYLALYWNSPVDAKPKRPRRPLTSGGIEHIAETSSTKKPPLSAASKRGLAAAFGKFNAYQLAKYDRPGLYRLRDVLRLTHPTPANAEQSAMWAALIKGELSTPDTWEVELSAGKDKKGTFERLLREQKLGGLAFLRNLRNMIAAGVDLGLICERLRGDFPRVLPFRFITAARYAPMLQAQLSDAMMRAVATMEPLGGLTYIVVDVSGSMDFQLAQKSELRREDAASALAILLAGICEHSRIFTFSERLIEVPVSKGLGLARDIQQSQPHMGTYLGGAIRALPNPESCDRLIVITDEQSHDHVQLTAFSRRTKAYLLNVGTYEYTVDFGEWIRINGWSEHVVDFVREAEARNFQCKTDQEEQA